MTIITQHTPNNEKLNTIIEKMKVLGVPIIKAFRDSCGQILSLEGSHRIAAAHALGLVPKIEFLALDDDVTDVQDYVNWPASGDTVAEIFEEMKMYWWDCEDCTYEF